LKNTDNENKALDREIKRMVQIDRVKVANARNSFFISETGGVLPTLDMFHAAGGSQQYQSTLAGTGREALHSQGADFASTI